MSRTVTWALALFILVSSAAASADPVSDWNERAGKAAIAACISPGEDPLHESRLYAMVHVAIHDALNAVDRRSRPYAYRARVRRDTSVEAAIAAAARHVLVAIIGAIPAPFPPACREAGIASVEADYAAALAAIPEGLAKARGVRLGRASAAAILVKREGDGSDTLLVDFDFPQGTNPGEHRFTPERPFAFAPGWANVTPFVLKRASQFRPGPPPALRSQRYAADVNEVKALGGDDVTTPSARNPEQTEIGLFWIESSPLAWNRLARSVAASQGLDSWQAARLFGLLNLAMADGYVASWDTKYHYLFWRPEVAIHEAGSDGNPRTTPDARWTPLQFTYPMPEYDSAHSVQGGAAAQVLADFFGSDAVAFTACSLTLPEGSRCTDLAPLLRTFASFSEAADENATSRIYIGVHFRTAVERGTAHGRQIGRHAVQRFLRPGHD